MRGRARALVGCLGCLVGALAACTDSTGLHVFVHRGNIAADELRFEVVLEPGAGGSSAPERIVNPETVGRRVGPFASDPVDVIVYLPERLAARTARCAATAMVSGATAGAAHATVTVARGDLTRVDLRLMAAPVVPDGAAGAGSGGGASGSGGAAGNAGAGGTDIGGGGTGGETGTKPDPACAGLHPGAICEPGRCDKNAKKATPPRVCDEQGRCGKTDPVDCGGDGLCAAGVCQPSAGDDDDDDDDD